MKHLTVEQVIALHSQLIAASGGVDGVRDKGLVESSLSNVFDVYFGVDRYPTIEDKASSLCYSLIKNHAFLDGNNFVMLVLLEINGIVLECTDEELVHLGIGIAASQITYEAILDFVENH